MSTKRGRFGGRGACAKNRPPTRRRGTVCWYSLRMSNGSDDLWARTEGRNVMSNYSAELTPSGFSVAPEVGQAVDSAVESISIAGPADPAHRPGTRVLPHGPSLPG